MKFKIQKSLLQEVLQSVRSAVPTKATFQVLNNYSLRLEGNILEVSATDLDLGVRLTVEVEGERDGAIIVNAPRLFDQVKSLSYNPSITEVSVDVENYLLTLRWSERGSASLNGFDASDFPAFPEIEDGVVFQMAVSELSFLAEKTLSAVSSDPSRVALNGAFFEAGDGKISLVATDGHRLGRAFVEREGVTLERGVIVPPKALKYVLNNVAVDASVEIRVSQKYILFLSDNLQVFSKLIEGPYPKYETVIPKKFSRSVQISAGDFLNKIRCVVSMSNARTRQICLKIEGSSMELSSTDPEAGGYSSDEIAVIHEVFDGKESHEGEGTFSIGFNGNYLSEILGMIKSEDIVMKMTSPIGATIFEPMGEGLNYSFLLMPLRLTSDT